MRILTIKLVSTKLNVDRGACIASVIILLLLLAQVSFAITPPPPGYVSASSYGYNTTDATAALQAAINTGSNVFVPKMEADWIVRPITMTTSNQDILFENGVVLMAKAGEFLGTNASLFTVKNNSDVTLSGYGASFMMRKNDYTQPPYPAGEWRMGIKLLGVTNVTVKGLKISYTGGDGIYVSGMSSSDYSENVVIKDILVDNAYRNGISIISAKDLLIDNAVIVNTGGTNPQYGIDFEPNNGELQRIENCIVRNSVIKDNARGGIGFDFLAGGPGNPINCLIENVTVVGNGDPNNVALSAGIASRCNFELGVTFKDLLIGNNVGAGFRLDGPGSQTITNSSLWDNTEGATMNNATLGAGTIAVAPQFYSTDINSPSSYMYLGPNTSPLIIRGAGDGGYMGARPVFRDPHTITPGISFPIHIADPSFQSPAKADGVDGTPASWITSAPGVGVWNPEGTYFTDAADDGTPSGADGSQILYMSGGGKYAHQVLTDTLRPGTYTLSVNVGRALPDTLSTDSDSFGFSLSTDVLGGLEDGSPLASYMGAATLLTAGAFVDQSLSLVVQPDNVHIGEFLRIDLGSVVGWGFFDNVRLDYRPVSGDANGDGMVDNLDAAILAANWLSNENVEWDQGDFNSDGKVDELDATILAANWSPVASSTQVPEPAMDILLLAVGGLFIWRNNLFCSVCADSYSGTDYGDVCGAD